MVNSLYERDFNEQGALKRPGRLDFRLLNNIDNAGDGYPGLQKAMRNWHTNNLLELYVEPGESIQEAIDNAMSEREYCVLILKAGTHGSADTFPITVNNANSAIWIRGEDKGVTIIEADTTYDNIFEVLNSKTTIISDIYFDCLDWDSYDYGSVILVNEANDNPVYIYRLGAICGFGKGYGGHLVEIQSDNVYIEYCEIDEWGTLFYISASCSNINVGYNIIGDDCNYICDNDNVTITHLHIYSNYSPSSKFVLETATTTNVTLSKNYFESIDISSCENLNIFGNYIINTTATDALDLAGITNYSVVGNIIHSSGSTRYPAALRYCTYGSIIGNEFYNDSTVLYIFQLRDDCYYNSITGNTFSGGQNGVFFNTNDDSMYNTVANNIFHNNSSTSITLTSGSNYNVINGNYTDTSPISIASNFNNISGNVCKSSTNGITISGSHNTISGNTCVYNSTSGINITGNSNTISGNVCNYNTLRGIYCTGDYNNINGNTCSINNTSSATDGGGIWLATDADYCNVSGNMCYGNTNDTGTAYGIYIGAGCDDTLVASNNCQGNETDYSDNGTNTVDDTAGATVGANLNRFD